MQAYAYDVGGAFRIPVAASQAQGCLVYQQNRQWLTTGDGCGHLPAWQQQLLPLPPPWPVSLHDPLNQVLQYLSMRPYRCYDFVVPWTGTVLALDVALLHSLLCVPVVSRSVLEVLSVYETLSLSQSLPRA